MSDNKLPVIKSTVICIGSNVPSRERIIDEVIEGIEGCCSVLRCSETYETPDDSGLGAPYLNVVLSVRPDVPRNDLIVFFKNIEQRFGRTPMSKASGIMPIDIDLVIWEGTILSPYHFSRPYFMCGYSSIL